MDYRREIDGLRAVAVIPVILFHAGISVFSGGYVGVDVFFVISGYLITSILITELDQGRFSILRFYERRARRILPALFLVMLCCIPFAWIWMLPQQFEGFAKSLVAVSLFSSNILFWQETNYFAPTAEEKPLLHTWSLAVEEQYYLLFPIFLILMWRFGRRPVFYAILAISLLSLLLSEWGWRTHPAANFYLLPTRAWELLAGSLCAFVQFGKAQKSGNALSALGLGLIVVSIFFYDNQTPFPSVYALAPVAGTVLIILYGAGDTWVGRLLSLKVCVGIGLISYSAYLWHQPLFAFARNRSNDAPEPWLMLLLSLAALVLAYFSWRFVETPFRKRKVPALASQRAVFTLAAATTAGFIAIGAVGYLTRGFEFRLPPAALEAIRFRAGDTSDCSNKFSYTEIENGAACIIGDTTVAPTIAVVGDSHAANLTDSLSQKLQNKKLSALAFNGSWCAPLVGFGTLQPDRNPECVLEMNASFSRIAKDPDIKVVVMAAQWSNYTKGYRGKDAGIVTEYFSQELEGHPDASNEDAVTASLLKTIDTLKKSNKRILLLRSTPEYYLHIPRAMARMLWWSEGLESLNIPRSQHLERNREISAIFDSVLEGVDVVQVDPHDLFCSNETCAPVSTDGVLLYEDTNHLSYEGSARVTAQIIPHIEHLLRD